MAREMSEERGVKNYVFKIAGKKKNPNTIVHFIPTDQNLKRGRELEKRGMRKGKDSGGRGERW